MRSDKDPSEANHSHKRINQNAFNNVIARDIQIGQIVQKIVYLGLPFNSHHLRFVQFVANSAYLTCLIGGFIRLWQNGADFTTLLLIIIGSGLLSLTCLYYAWFWKPEVQDKSAPSSEQSDSELVKAQQIKQRSRQRTRRLAIVGIFAIPLLTFGGFFVWRSLPPPKVLVLVAEFDGSSEEEHKVGARLRRDLEYVTKEYSDVAVKPLGKTIPDQKGSDVARAEGEQKKATIVIWGWYSNVPDSDMTVNFELLRSPTYFPKQKGETVQDIRSLKTESTPVTANANSFGFLLKTNQNQTYYFTLFTLGMVRYAAGEWKEAIPRFKNALHQVSETNVSTLNKEAVYFYRGVCYYNNSNFNEAIADYNQAIKLKPDFVEAYNNRGNTYAKQGNYTQAFTDYNKAINLNPNLAEAYNGRGIVYRNQGKYTQALVDFNKAIELKPNNAEAYTGRGNVYVAQGDFAQAIINYNKAIKLNSNLIEAYYNRGVAYVGQGNYTKAFADYDKAIELNENSIEAYNNRGMAHFEQGNFDKALVDFNKAIELDQNSGIVYNNRGNVYAKQGNLTQAFADYNKAIELNPNDAHAYNGRGNVYGNQGNFTKAFADYSKAIELKRDFSEAYYNWGSDYYNQGNYSQAILNYDKAIEFKQGYAGAYNARGAAYTKQGNYTQALADFNKAIELNPNAAFAYYNKAGVYSLKREFKEAIENLQQAIQLDAKLREDAKTDSDFDNIRKDEQFRALVGK
ncbi:MAG: tetratricopeptide repeat protein [Nostoc sp. EfeVER01]|uniref:tetratricopeptide repeat protein n=1 Tax=unclassified Nostoc TaxID=2593658 RepID=UPI002AD374C1|nr:MULTISPECIES: tetratricopeptide repeat protein [unclassified Nostoc]MDZ7948475.1 tetratricopeptide repeat protein [Nostoc sp. EfeVER01]MDZ7991789.1 tetratricopeptide repeat protein [Nostoc sp. EspVER01]